MNRIPWQYSQAIGGEFVYLPRSDELVFRDGRRVTRPSTVPRDRLASASYEGPLEPANSQAASPPNHPAYISHAAGNNNPQAIQNLPQHTARSDASSTSSHQTYSLNLNPGSGSAHSRQLNRGPEQSTSNAPLRLTPSNPAPGSLATTSGSSIQSQAQLLTGMNAMTLSGPSTAVRRDTIVDVTAGPNMGLGPQTNVRTDRISGAALPNGPDLERLHPHYRIRPSDFYQLGKVFSILWSEPTSDKASVTQAMTSRTKAITTGPMGQRIYSKVRRFVVIRFGVGYCNALPISTYEKRGVSKRGVTKSEHTVIFTTPRPTIQPDEEPQRGENGMRPKWIRVDPDRVEDKLDRMSRLNFAGPVTIQFNVKAKSVGMVAQECRADLMNQFHNVFGLPAPPQTTPVPNAPNPSNPVVRSTASNRDTEPIRQLIYERVNRGMTRSEAIRSVARDLVRSRGLTEEAAAALLLNMFA